MIRILKIGGATLGGLLLLIAGYVTLLLYPGMLFAHEVTQLIAAYDADELDG